MNEQTPGPEQRQQSNQSWQSSPGQPQQPGISTGQPGDLVKRFLARLIDGVLVGIVYFIVSGIITSVMAPSVATMGFAPGAGATSAWLAGFVTTLVMVALNLGYFTFMESNRGQTVGKMLLNLRVYGPTGGNPTTTEAVKRNIWLAASLLSIIPAIGWFLGGIAGLAAVIVIAVGINNDTVSRKGWHDDFAGGTRVVISQ